MIDKKLVESVIRKNATMLSIVGEMSLIEEMQMVVGVGEEGITSNNERFINFDAFGFSWDRQLRDDKLRLLASAYRRNKDLFGKITMEDRLRWCNFNLAQRAVIIQACDELLLSVMSLFCNKMAAEDFLSGYLDAMKTKEESESRQVLKMAASS